MIIFQTVFKLLSGHENVYGLTDGQTMDGRQSHRYIPQTFRCTACLCADGAKIHTETFVTSDFFCRVCQRCTACLCADGAKIHIETFVTSDFGRRITGSALDRIK